MTRGTPKQTRNGLITISHCRCPLNIHELVLIAARITIILLFGIVALQHDCVTQQPAALPHVRPAVEVAVMTPASGGKGEEGTRTA